MGKWAKAFGHMNRNKALLWLAFTATGLAGCSLAPIAKWPVIQERASVPVRMAPVLHALGTEPYWTLDIQARKALYRTPEQQAGVPVYFNWDVTHTEVVYRGQDSQRVPVQLQVFRQPCSDGRTDRVYPLAVQLQYGQQRRTGCGWAP